MNMLTKAAWDDRLQCRLISLTYDFRTRTGQVYLFEGDCCDMTGCVTLFEGIDSEVTAVDTFAGDKADAVYRKQGRKWSAA
jgi:hypothetical protein